MIGGGSAGGLFWSVGRGGRYDGPPVHFDRENLHPHPRLSASLPLALYRLS